VRRDVEYTAKRPGTTNAKRRIPKLCYTATRNIGWHAHYRDTESGIAKRKRFGMIPEADAKRADAAWLARHLAGETDDAGATPTKKTPRGSRSVSAVPGSLLEVASGVFRLMQASV
jgi:hypothetical protein